MISSHEQIPYLALQQMPMDVQIRIRQDGSGRYSADILPYGQSSEQRVPIDMSKEDLRELNEQLREVMQCTIQQYSTHSTRKLLVNTPELVDATEKEVRFLSLAEIGHITFKRVWKHPDAMATMKELLAVGRHLHFQISSEDFFLPWELLYPVGLDEPLSIHHFWGMRHIISRILVQRQRSGAFVSPSIVAHAGPKLGLLTYDDLDAVITKEIPFFERLEAEEKIHLRRLRSLNANPQKKAAELTELRFFCNHPFDLLHFACHAFHDYNQPGHSYLILSDKFSLRIHDIEAYNIKITGNPLVIINACGTGNLNPLYTSYFAATFLKLGARGVVSTECEVPDDFAADFIGYLYALLLQGVSIGASLLQTRKHFAEAYDNPSGLLYSLYGSPFIQLNL